MHRILFCTFIIVQCAFAQTSRSSVAPDWQPYVTVPEQRDSVIAWSFDRALSFGNLSPARFLSVDRLADRFPGWSPYAYSFSNPIVFIDPSGDSAWTIHSQWNQQTIAGYQQYASQRAQQLAQSGASATCEDFALRVLIDYASTNGLPLAIANGSGTFNAASDQFTDVAGFTNTVLTTTGASDLQNPANTVGVDMSQLSAGDLLLTRSNGVTANHVQLVTSVSDNYMGIHQGSVTWLNGLPGASRILGASNPTSIFYAGTPITHGSIFGNTAYVNRGTGTIQHNYFRVNNIQTRRWHFGGW